MTRAWSYCRVSTQRQCNRGNSLAAQSEQAIRFADYQKNLDLDLGPAVTRDFGELGTVETRERVICEAVSGLHVPFRQRKGAAWLLGKMQPGDALIVTKLDRLGRNVRDMRDTLDDLIARKIVVFVLDIGNSDLPINATQGATGKLLLGILMTLAEFESERRGERVREAGAVRRVNGLGCGPPPLLLTYDPDPNAQPGVLIPCEFNRSRARAFYEAYCVHGMRVQEIVEAAAAIGLRSRGRWSKKTNHCPAGFRNGRQYSESMVKQMIRAQHQLRQLATEMGLPDNHESVIYAQWNRCQSEDSNLRLSIPEDCHCGKAAYRRPRKDDRFMRPDRRPSPEAVALHHVRLLRELVEGVHQPEAVAAG
jgi:putative DNA-invertase from lambdoid prophage Rac